MAQAQAMLLPVALRSTLTQLASAEVADDQKWILRLMRRHGLQVVTMLWRMLGSESDVLDAYQTTLCQIAHRGRDGLGRNPSGYFYRTAVHAGIELIRQRQRRRKHYPGIGEAQAWQQREQSERGSTCQQLHHRESVAALRRAIGELPPYLRNVIVLRDLAQLPYREVASTLGITVGTARLYRRQAIVRLADLLDEEVAP